MKARDTVTGLIGLIVGVILTLLTKSCCSPTPPPVVDAGSDAALEAAPLEAAVEAASDDAPTTTLQPARACPPGCNARQCKPGEAIPCFGCGVNGSNQQVTGQQVCGRDGLWGSCSAGPACSPFAIVDSAEGGVAPLAAATKCPTECKPGNMLICFGCPQGNNQQKEGSRMCQKNGMWGPCSAGPDCQ